VTTHDGPHILDPATSTPGTNRPLEIREERVLLDFVVFALNRKLDDYRTDLLDHMVLLGLAKSTVPATSTALRDSLTQEYKLSSVFPINLLESILGRLVQSGRIDQIGSDAWQPSEATSHLLGQQREAVTIMHESALSAFVGRVEHRYRPISASDRIMVARELYSYFSLWFSQESHEAARALLVTDPPPARFTRRRQSAMAPTMHALIRSSFTRIAESGLRVACRRALGDLLRSPDGNERTFLLTLAEAYLALNILRLDPHAKLISRELIGQIEFCIDTNIATRLLLPDDPYHSSNVRLISLGRQIGINFTINSSTCRELSKLLRGPVLRDRSVLPGALDYLSKVQHPTAPVDANLSSSGVTWAATHIDESQVSDLLLHLFDIHLDTTEVSSQRAQYLAGIEREVSGAWAELHHRSTKTPEAIQHDAILFELGAERRKQGRHLFYIISTDRSMSILQRRMNDERLLTSLFLRPETAYEMELPFLVPAISSHEREEVFARLLSSPEFVAAGRVVNADAIDLLQDLDSIALTVSLPRDRIRRLAEAAMADLLSSGQDDIEDHWQLRRELEFEVLRAVNAQQRSNLKKLQRVLLGLAIGTVTTVILSTILLIWLVAR
jgi:hypothetical protein